MSHKKLGQIIIDLRKENVETGEPRPVSSSLQKYLLEIKKYIVNTQIVNNLNVLQDSKNISLLIWDDNASMGKLLNANLTVEDVGTIRIYAVDYIALSIDNGPLRSFFTHFPSSWIPDGFSSSFL